MGTRMLFNRLTQPTSRALHGAEKSAWYGAAPQICAAVVAYLCLGFAVPAVADSLTYSSSPPLLSRIRSRLIREDNETIWQFGTVLNTSDTVPVYTRIYPDTLVAGITSAQRRYPVLAAGKQWCKIAYNGPTGWQLNKNSYIDMASPDLDKQVAWIRREHLDVVTVAPTGIPLSLAKLILILLCVPPAYMLLGYLYAKFDKLKSQWVMSASIERSMILVAEAEHEVPCVYAWDKHKTTIRHCFQELGFGVKIAPDLESFAERIARRLPDVIVVDWTIVPRVQQQLESLISQRSSTANLSVIFYNVPDLSVVSKTGMAGSEFFLGPNATDGDIYSVVSEILSNEQKAENIRKSVTTSALEGDISGDTLCEVLQFIEMSSKTGCLLVETKKPEGIVFFKDGLITYAAARNSTGQKAVFELLDLAQGRFRFVLDREPSKSNCTLPTIGVLMQWSQHRDETKSLAGAA
jgi:hypothetical protein